MKVEAIIQQVDTLIGQEIVVEGYIIVLEEAKNKICYVSSTEEISEKDQQQILIEHTIAELRTIIHPLPLMQLMYRGIMTNPPYFQRFPATFHATVNRTKTAHGKPILQNITEISLDVPYIGKTSEVSLHDYYPYYATVDYTPTSEPTSQRTARAIVNSQKVLVLDDSDYTMEIIAEDENRYARRLAQQLIQISGWLESIPSKNELINYLLFMTTSLRRSMVAIGPLREETSILIPPSDVYTLIRSHINRKPEQTLHQVVDIVGKVDYLADDYIPAIGEKSPKLHFTEITRVIIHDKSYLW